MEEIQVGELLDKNLVNYVTEVKFVEGVDNKPKQTRIFKDSAARLLLYIFDKNGLTDGSQITESRKSVINRTGPNKEFDLIRVTAPDYKYGDDNMLYVTVHKSGVPQGEDINEYIRIAKQIKDDFIYAAKNEMAKNPFGGKKRRRTMKRHTRSRKHKKSRKH